MQSTTETSISDGAAPAQRRRLFPAVLLSAVLATLAYPPADLGWLAWIALAPLFYVLPMARRTRHAFALGYLFGFLHWGWTVTWIGATVVNWAHTPLGWIAWFLLTAIKAGWFGLFGGVAWWIGRRTEGHARAVALAAAWTIIEWLRAQGSLAMPWSLLGYTQYRFPLLIQVADLAGVFGVSFVLVLTNAAIAEGVGRWESPLPSEERAEKGEGQGVRVNRLYPITPLLLPLAVLAGVLIYGAFSLRRDYGGVPVRLTLMQPDLNSLRRDAATPQQELALFRTMTARAIQNPKSSQESRRADAGSTHAVIQNLVVWPESAAPTGAINVPEEREAFAEMARMSGAWHMVGTGYEDLQRRPHNSAALFAPDGSLAGRYDKRWLVPYGEWMPGRSWMPFSDVFHYIEQDNVAGHSDAPLAAGPARLCVLICYESVFPVLTRASVAQGANLLVSITNDSWAGRSAQPQQHIAMAVLRAVETRRWLAAAALTGITALIGPDGSMTAAPPYREEMLIGVARLRNGLTPYVRFGDWLVGACALVLSAFLWRGREGIARRRR
jgi:apolipoprotein N-acyltransferase